MAYQIRRANGSGTPAKFPTFDSPGHYGWTKRNTDSTDGVIIWQLVDDGEVIAVMKPDQTFCNVAIMADPDKPFWIEIPGNYATVTESARRLYAALVDDAIFAEGIHWDGEPEDLPVVDIPFLGEPMYPPDYIGESGL